MVNILVLELNVNIEVSYGTTILIVNAPQTELGIVEVNEPIVID
jgi:hypothetical protein